VDRFPVRAGPRIDRACGRRRWQDPPPCHQPATWNHPVALLPLGAVRCALACDDESPLDVELPAYDLVFEDSSTSTPERLRRNVDTGLPERLLPSGNRVQDPALPPAGTLIAFVV
jgi:hypothetical protein